MPKITNKDRSLGGVRPSPSSNSNPLAPEGLGRILLQADLIENLYAELQRTRSSQVEAGLACWFNKRKLPKGKVDKFITIEIRALRVTDTRWSIVENPKLNTLEDHFN